MSGNVLFRSLQWNVATTLQSLDYAASTFKGVTWHASTSVTADVLLSAATDTGVISTVKIPLFSVNTPPEVIPVPLLEFVTVNADIDIFLEVTLSATLAQDQLTASWSAAAELLYEWEITCSVEEGTLVPSCSGTVITATATYTTAPSGTIAIDTDTTDATASVQVSLGMAVGLQMDEVLALNDQVSLQLVLDAPALPCATMSAQILDSVDVSLRILTIDVMSVFNYPVYHGDSVVMSVDNGGAAACSPTTAPSLVPNAWYDICTYNVQTGELDAWASACSFTEHQHSDNDDLWYDCIMYTYLQTVHVPGVGDFQYNMHQSGLGGGQLYFLMDSNFLVGSGYSIVGNKAYANEACQENYADCPIVYLGESQHYSHCTF
jgi:hypothetical protein